MSTCRPALACFGCEAQTEYRVYSGHVEQGQPRAQGIPPVGHLLEESSCLARACCGASRGFQMNFTAPDAEGKKLLVFKKGWSLPICCVVPAGENGSISCPCCCCPAQAWKHSGNERVGNACRT